jgi:hypothetical protein
MSFWSDLVGTIEQVVIGNPAGVSNPSGPAVGAVGAASTGQLDAILGIWTELRDGKMWRSLGWLLLGIVLMLLGAGWWLGPSAARAAPTQVITRGLA